MIKSPFNIMVFLLVIISLALCPLFAAEPLKPGNYYFTADWCNYCQEQGIDIQTLQNQGFDIQIYNQEEIPDIFKNLNIRELPTIIVVRINEKGRQIYIRLKGKQPIKKLSRY